MTPPAPTFAKRARTALVVAVMVLAALLSPLALPVSLLVRWVRREGARTEQVLPAPRVRLLRPP